MSSGVGWVDMVKNPVDRRRTLLAIAAVSLQAASGAMFIIGEYTFSDYCHLVLTLAHSLQSLLPYHGKGIEPICDVQRTELHRHFSYHCKLPHHC